MAFLLYPFFHSFFWPWSKMQCRTQSVDLNTGKMKTEGFYWFYRYSREFKNSFVFDADQPFVESDSRWVRCTTLSYGHGNSPHYNYHGLIYEANTLETILRLHNVSKSDISKYKNEFIEVMKGSDSDFELSEFNHMLGQKLDRNN